MKSIRVLLIDDEANVLNALQRILRKHASATGQVFSIESQTSPLAAVALAREQTFDVVVCDYRMPELDGVETLRRIREVQPHTARILLSGSREFDAAIDAVNVAQVGRFVLKPWDEVELLSAIQDAAETRRLRLENIELANELRVQKGQISAHEAELQRIESMWPGITRVQWNSDGSISLGEGDEPSLASN